MLCHDDDDDVSFLVGHSPREYSLRTQGIVICERVCVFVCLSVFPLVQMVVVAAFAVQGRYNLFHALVAFLYHIKTKENGLLG